MKCAYTGKNKPVMDKSRNKRRFLHCWLFRNTVNNLFRSRVKYPTHVTTIASIRLGLLKVETPDYWPLNFGNTDWKPETSSLLRLSGNLKGGNDDATKT